MGDTDCYIPLENQFDEDDKLFPSVPDTHIVTQTCTVVKRAMIIQILLHHSLKMFAHREGAGVPGMISCENRGCGIKQFHVKCLRMSSKCRIFFVLYMSNVTSRCKRPPKTLVTKSSFTNCVIQLTSVQHTPCTEYISERAQLKIHQSKGATKFVTLYKAQHIKHSLSNIAYQSIPLQWSLIKNIVYFCHVTSTTLST